MFVTFSRKLLVVATSENIPIHRLRQSIVFNLHIFWSINFIREFRRVDLQERAN